MKDKSITIFPPEELKEKGSLLEYAVLTVRSMLFSDDRFPDGGGQRFALGDIEVYNLTEAAKFVGVAKTNFHYHLRKFQDRSGKKIPTVKTGWDQRGALYLKNDLIPLRAYIMAKNGQIELPRKEGK